MSRKRSVTITQEDVMYVALGAAGGMALNGVLNKALEKMPNKEMIGKAVPAAKLLGGGFLATQKKQSRNIRMIGLGLAGTGAVELGQKFAPEYFSIGSADIFDYLGSSDLTRVPVIPAAPLEEDDEVLTGVGMTEYAEMEAVL